MGSMTVTLTIILVTAAISLICFADERFFDSLKFNAYDIWHGRQWYRLFSHGLVHGSWVHLFFNMFTLYFFGTAVEQYFSEAFGERNGPMFFILMYVTAFAVSSVADLFKYCNNPEYNAVGASGAVSAVLFAAILFNPKMGIYIYLIPISVPGYIFGPLYLVYCQYMSRRGIDNVGHSAHFWVAVYGFLFPLLINPKLMDLFLSYF